MISEQQHTQVEERLGRSPRGLREIAVSDDDGQPMVIRVASIVDGKPFPTLFWLIDPALKLRIDREEAAGAIAELQQQVNGSPALQAALARDHRRHIERRLSHLSAGEREQLEAGGMLAAVVERGIGGIADFSRIRCLHTWYAAHLVEANSVGRWLDRRWESSAQS